MIEKERLNRLHGIIQNMQNSGEGESVHVAEWLKILLSDLEPDQDLLSLTTSLEELRDTAE